MWKINMKICVVIPTFNNNELLRKLLAQLPAIAEFNQLITVVVDNGSSDGTSKMVKANFPAIQLLTLTSNSGGSGGFIAGVNHAMTLDVDYIWLLDDDVVIKDNTLTLLLNAAEKLDSDNISWGAIGSMMANLDKPQFVVETGAEVNWRNGGFKLYDNGAKIEDIKPKIKRVQYCAAASLLTRPKVIAQVGFFENVFIHFDDVEWCMRMDKAGFGIYCNTASVFWHATVKDAPVTWVRYYDARNFLWLCKKHNPKWFYWGIIRMIVKGLYFKLHRMPAITKLYKLGIKDAFSGKLRMRSELKTENMVDAETILPELQDRKIIGVFQNSTGLTAFRRLYPSIVNNIEKTYFYEQLRAPASCKKYFKFIKLWVLLQSFWAMLCHPKSLVIFDGACYHGIMLPPFLNDTFYLFFRHKKVIRRVRNEK
jgi:GT2 family glycosyltransferase